MHHIRLHYGLLQNVVIGSAMILILSWADSIRTICICVLCGRQQCFKHYL